MPKPYWEISVYAIKDKSRRGGEKKINLQIWVIHAMMREAVAGPKLIPVRMLCIYIEHCLNVSEICVFSLSTVDWTEADVCKSKKASLSSFIFCKRWEESSTNCGELESDRSWEWKMQNQKSILISILSEIGKIVQLLTCRDCCCVKKAQTSEMRIPVRRSLHATTEIELSHSLTWLCSFQWPTAAVALSVALYRAEHGTYTRCRPKTASTTHVGHSCSIFRFSYTYNDFDTHNFHGKQQHFWDEIPSYSRGDLHFTLCAPNYVMIFIHIVCASLHMGEAEVWLCVFVFHRRRDVSLEVIYTQISAIHMYTTAWRVEKRV